MQRRVQGRNLAKTALELVRDELTHADSITTFIEELREQLQPKVAAEEKAEVRRKLSVVAAITLDFGQYAGQMLSLVPRRYLEWLLKQSEQLVNNLREFLQLTAHMAEAAELEAEEELREVDPDDL